MLVSHLPFGCVNCPCAKANAATEPIPVILVTAKVQESDQQSFARLQVAAIFAKPFRPLKLPQEISKALGWDEM